MKVEQRTPNGLKNKSTKRDLERANYSVLNSKKFEKQKKKSANKNNVYGGGGGVCVQYYFSVYKEV